MSVHLKYRDYESCRDLKCLAILKMIVSSILTRKQYLINQQCVDLIQATFEWDGSVLLPVA